ncbi:site-specific integrase [Halococcus sp. IIIV-5B]|uniref:site-specific integrase n=1 Tax=Halococcus sp. IIIV-5B TaxID=2321230 RepID=UPI000E75F355|nr:site-specific integrase [Halococcus sp. IIIV-5B]RJS96554.1 site-specific integrase [Halococcus sp. IIIV-5B]
MRLKENPDDEKMRVWMSGDEMDALYGYYEGDYRRRFALMLMGECGLRSHEVLDFTPGHIQQMDADEVLYKLRIPHGKGDKPRETVIPNDLRNEIVMFANMNDVDDDAPLVDVTKRTLRNWVRKAADSRPTDDEGWHHVGTHDLRRSWAGRLVDSDVSPLVIMELGGWEDYATFRDHYLNELSDRVIASEVAEIAG